MSELLFDFSGQDLYVSASAHTLGPISNTLEELAQKQLLASPMDSLREVGYRSNRSADPDSNVLDFTSGLFRELIEKSQNPSALVVHHSYSANTSDAIAPENRELLARASYFPASLLRRFELDHIPYWGSYSSGCTGFMSLLTLASAIFRAASVESVICLTADLKPAGSTFDSVRERLLTSDAASGFVASRDRKGYQVLGVGQYSSSRQLIPLVEVVKRAVQMTRQLCDLAKISCDGNAMLCHYPNMFVEAWRMVSHFMKVPEENHIVDGLAERAHCLSSDAIISIEKFSGTGPGRMHAVYSFGSGLHLAVAILKEI